MNATTTALDTNVTRREPPKNFPAMLDAWLPEIQRALPKHLSAERISRIALTAFRRNPTLDRCDPRSVFAAVIQSSQLGLEIDTLGRAYLVPYKANKKIDGKWESHYECQFIPGWKGLVDLMNRSGQGTVWTGAVFQDDEFDWQLGDNPFVHHKPQGESDPKLMTHTYAIGRVKGSDYPIIEVWPVRKVWAHRDRYNKVGDKHYSYENEEMYARKVPLLQVLKYMPCSAELATAIALDGAAEVGRQKLDVNEAITGTWTPTPDEDEGAGEGAAQHQPNTGASATALREAVKRNAGANGGNDAGAAAGAGTVAEPKGAPPAEITLEVVLGYIEKSATEDQADIALDMGKGILNKKEWAAATEARNTKVQSFEPA